MALPLHAEADNAAEIIQTLENALGRNDAALRRAVPQAGALAPSVIELVEKAANGVYLLPKQRNLLYWGIHILAAGRRTELCRPLLRLAQFEDHEYLDDLFGDSITETLKRVFISVFDGDSGPLLTAAANRSAEGYVRWGLLCAIARLTFDGAIPRPTALSFLARFERESLADAGDPAWEGWQEAVFYLGFEELHERVRQAWNDGRIPEGIGDRDYWERQIAIVRTLAPGDPGMFNSERLAPITDPVEPLRWLQTDAEMAARQEPPSKGRFGPDPALNIALGREEYWLAGFLRSQHVPAFTMSLEELDGYFCAIAACPNIATPDEYMPNLWNLNSETRASPNYDSEAQAEYVDTLITRHMNAITARLEAGYPHEPLTGSRYDADRGLEWAIGFARGATLHAPEWGARGDEDARNLLGVVTAIVDPDADDSRAWPPSLRSKLFDRLPLILLSVHHAWRGRDPSKFKQKDVNADRRLPLRVGRKIGRNEPCTCGSGKKYKRCCGSAEKRSLTSE
jgi:uncharacterized protein